MADTTLQVQEWAAGGAFPSAGDAVPQHYGDPAAERQALARAAGLLDLSYRGKLRVTGSDRATYLHGQITQEVRSLTPGDTRPGALITVQGNLVATFRLLVTDAAVLLDMEPDALPPLKAALERFIILEDVTVEDVSREIQLISVQGPRAGEILAKSLGVDPAQAPEGRALPVPGTPGAWVAAEDHTGQGGFDLLAPAEAMPDLWGRVLAEGVPLGLAPVGEQAREELRIEAGIPRWGRDLGPDVNPLEAGLEHAVSDTKGCYVGQEILARIQSRGQPSQRLVGLISTDWEVPPAGTPVEVDGRQVGRITSAVHSPRLDRPIALGYVRKEHALPGTEVVIAQPSGQIRAHVSALPFPR